MYSPASHEDRSLPEEGAVPESTHRVDPALTLLSLLEDELASVSDGLATFQRGQNVGLAGHNAPDPDSIASIAGMAAVLEFHGLKPRMHFPEDMRSVATRLGSMVQKLLQASVPANGDPSILLDTSHWQNSTLKSAPRLIVDNHDGDSQKIASPKFAAVSTLVTALLLEHESGKDFLRTERGGEIAALLMMGILTDCRFVPGSNVRLKEIPNALPGMQAADALAYEALLEYASDSALGEFESSQFWQVGTASISNARLHAQRLLVDTNDYVFVHHGVLPESRNCIRGLIADALTLGDSVSQSTPYALAVVSTIQGDYVKVSIRIDDRGPVADPATAKKALERFFERLEEFTRDSMKRFNVLSDREPISFGVRGSAVGGAKIPIAHFAGEADFALEAIEDAGAAAARVLRTAS